MPERREELEHDSEEDQRKAKAKALPGPAHDKMMRPKVVKKPEKKPWCREDNEAIWTPI